MPSSRRSTRLPATAFPSRWWYRWTTLNAPMTGRTLGTRRAGPPPVRQRATTVFTHRSSWQHNKHANTTNVVGRVSRMQMACTAPERPQITARRRTAASAHETDIYLPDAGGRSVIVATKCVCRSRSRARARPARSRYAAITCSRGFRPMPLTTPPWPPRRSRTSESGSVAE